MDERDFYGEVRDLLLEWADENGGNVSSIRTEIDSIVEDVEAEYE